MGEVEPTQPAHEPVKPRGPAMLLVLFLSLFVSAPGWAQCQLSSPARVDQRDVHVAKWSGRPQSDVFKAKKAAPPLAVLPPALELVTHAIALPAAAARTAKVLLPARAALAYLARAPPAR